MSKYSDVWMGQDDSVIDGSGSGHAIYDEKVGKKVQPENMPKPICPKCGSHKVKVGYSSQNDHHQQDFMTEYSDFTCQDCDHKWEK